MNLHVERYGSGQPVVFVHGATGSTLSWYFQREYLQRFVEVILFDLPGHGRSPGDGCERLEECRDALYDTLRNMRVQKLFMAGHSMGGALAMLFALAHPARPDSRFKTCADS